jgi:hypothetical protein
MINTITGGIGRYALKAIYTIQLMAKDKKQARSRTQSERLKITNETKMKCIELELTEEVATNVLFAMLDKYHEDGTTYIGKELQLSPRHLTPRKYVVNLWNSMGKKDTVLIRELDDTETLVQKRRNSEQQARSVVDTWVRDSESDDEAPGLVDA